MAYQIFESAADVREYIESEVIIKLQEDLERMETYDHPHYTDADRDAQRARIHDVRLFINAR